MTRLSRSSDNQHSNRLSLFSNRDSQHRPDAAGRQVVGQLPGQPVHLDIAGGDGALLLEGFEIARIILHLQDSAAFMEITLTVKEMGATHLGMSVVVNPN